MNQNPTPTHTPDASRRRPHRHRPPDTAAGTQTGAPTEKPFWDEDTHTLWSQGQVVKHFKGKPGHQEAILLAFQRAGWPPCLAAAVLEVAGVKGKFCLRATVQNLNQSVWGRLQFHLEGQGTRIRWECNNRL